MKEKVVNLLGMGYGAYDAPLDGDRWALNNGFTYEKIDRLFWMHDEETTRADFEIQPGTCLDVLAYLKKSPKMEIVGLVPYTIEDHDGKMIFNYSSQSQGKVIRNVKKFPIEESMKIMGQTYFPWSIIYMIAMAIIEKYDRIRLYGFECWSRASYLQYGGQHRCLENWIMFARGRGIKTDISFQIIPAMGEKNNLYGYLRDEDVNKETKETGNRHTFKTM